MGNVGGTLQGAIKETGSQVKGIGSSVLSTVNNPLTSTDYMIIFGFCILIIIIIIIIGFVNIKSPNIDKNGYEIVDCSIPETLISKAGDPVQGMDGKCFKMIKEENDGEFVHNKPHSKGTQWIILLIILVAALLITFFGMQQIFWMIRNPVGASAAIGARQFGLIKGGRRIK